MSKQYFLPKRAELKAITFEQFRDNVAPYVVLFDLVPADITQQAADATYFRELLTLAQTMGSAGLQWIGWKNNVLTGTIGSEPAMVTKPAGFPAAVAPGIQTRFLAQARSIKNHKKYTIATGEILGLEGAEEPTPDLATLQPNLEVSISGNRVFIDWGWQGNGAFLDQIEMQVDRNDGKGYVLLCFDTTPGYSDGTPFPAAPVKWTYRAIYRADDQQVGLWSKPTAITVG